MVGRAAIPVPSPGIVTFSVVLGATLQVLDTTMLTVALPHMQGNLSATQDEITWVLTSYLVAVAVATPAVGVLVARVGRKRLFLIAVAGFLATSVCSGLSDSLTEMVIFRFAQGVFAAPLVPVSQSVLFDVYPDEQRGVAMGWWTLGLMFGMTAGPSLGGLITEFHNWRGIFYVNLPIGALAFVMISVFVPRTGVKRDTRFGYFGFFVLALSLVSLQLLLSRGERMDWFNATEIIIAAGLTVSGFYIFAVHTLTSRHPFIHRDVFRDRNFVVGQTLMLMLGGQWLAALALLPPYIQVLAGYPVDITGLVLAPQGLGNMVGALVAGRLVARIDPRLPLAFGGMLIAGSTWMMSQFTPDLGPSDVAIAIAMHGLGLGFYFVPLTVISFSTLAPQHRDVGTSIYAVMRGFGSSIAASLVVAYVVRHTQANHANLVEHVTPFSETLRHLPLPGVWSLGDLKGLAALNAEVTRQAAALAYVDDFHWLAICMVAAIPLVLLIRMPRAAAPALLPARQ